MCIQAESIKIDRCQDPAVKTCEGSYGRIRIYLALWAHMRADINNIWRSRFSGQGSVRAKAWCLTLHVARPWGRRGYMAMGRHPRAYIAMITGRLCCVRRSYNPPTRVVTVRIRV